MVTQTKQILNLKIANLLGDDIEKEYESFGATNQTFSKRSLRTAFSLGYSLKI